MGVSGRVRVVAIAFAAALVLALAFALAQGRSDAGAAAATESAAKRTSAQRMLLRLHDLGLGYFFPTIGAEGAEREPPEITCDKVRPADPEPNVAEFVRRYSPGGCMTLYARIYDVPGDSPTPQMVGTGALDAGSRAAADAGFAVAPELLSHAFLDEALTEVSPPATVGDASRLFHWDEMPPVFGGKRETASVFVWRSGDVLAAVFVASPGSTATNDREAIAFARRQQKHIEHPTPYTAAERYDRDVGLDDPAIEVPVYWLGRSFKPASSLPRTNLQGGSRSYPPPDGLLGQKFEIAYSGELQINSWTARSWKRFLTTPLSERFRTWACTETMEVDLPRGAATLYGAYNRDYADCPDRRPTRYFAIARIGGTVIAVNFVVCRECISPTPSAYNSFGAMRTIVQGLRLRPKPTP